MKILLLAFCLLHSAGATAQNEMYWFKTELTCADARITIRAFCEETYHAGETKQFNSLCSRQALVIERAGHPTAVRNLLERQPNDGEVPLLLSSLRCVAAGEKTYLAGLMDNGGNCNTCERGVLFDLNGVWKQDGQRWLVRGQERRLIAAHQTQWHDAEQVFIPNITRDTARGK